MHSKKYLFFMVAFGLSSNAYCVEATRTRADVTANVKTSSLRDDVIRQVLKVKNGLHRKDVARMVDAHTKGEPKALVKLLSADKARINGLVEKYLGKKTE